MELVFRKADKQDLEEIERVVKCAIAEMNTNKIPQWDELYPTGEDFEQDIIKEELFVGQIEEKIAVLFALNQETDEAYESADWKYPQKSYEVIHRLCVHPCFQGKGVAKMTMDFIEKFLTGKGIESIRLDVFSRNPYALKLYEKCGFKKTGEANWRKGKFYLMEKYLKQ